MTYQPKTVGRYRVITKLGQGGMATALLAMSEGPGGFRKLSVIKRLLPTLADDPEFVAMFLDEARIAALLRHPNVVQTHEVASDAGAPFMALEYLEGQTYSRARRNLRGDLHLRVIAETLAGLHHVHELTDLAGTPLHVVHRDVSPSNLFVTYDGEVKVLDFGVAKAAGGNVQTVTGGFKGKVSYMAPEQAQTTRVDRRADLFSVGVLLWEALAGRSLAPRDQPEALSIQNRVTGKEPGIDEAAPDAPRALRAVCRKALSLDPEHRFGSAREFRDALEDAVGPIVSGPSPELAEVMRRRFAKERKAIADAIAQALDDDAPTPTNLGALARGKPTTDSAQWPRLLESVPVVDGQRDGFGDGNAAWPAQTTSRGTSGLRTAWLAGLLLGLVGGGYVFLSERGGGDADPVAEPQAVPAAAPDTDVSEGEPADEPAGELADEPAGEPSAEGEGEGPRLTISAEPPNAAILLDGELIAHNPFETRYLAARSRHTVEVVAAGYETARREFRLDGDIDLEIALERIEPVAVAAAGDGDAPGGAPGAAAPKDAGREGSADEDVDDAPIDDQRADESRRASRDARRRQADRREAQRRAERKEAQRREAERREAERREAERRAERKEAERKEAERKEAERKEAERKEAEREAARRRAAASKSDDAESPGLRPGDSLRKRSRKKQRQIDKDNPYQ